MRPERLAIIRRTAVKGGLLGMVLAVGISAAGTAPAPQRNGQSGAPVVTDPSVLGNPNTPTSMPDIASPGGGMDPAVRAHMEAERLKAANDDRHKRLVSDVDKLISLSNELKTDVDKTDKDELSLDVIRKAQEIEKLAHDVQNRMKN